VSLHSQSRVVKPWEQAWQGRPARQGLSSKACRPAFFISIILGSTESDLYWSVGATFIQIIDESTFIHPNVYTFI
jgi:hypothetical protein